MFLLLQLHWEQSHIQHGDRGGLPAVRICPGAQIPDAGKDFGIRNKKKRHLWRTGPSSC